MHAEGCAWSGSLDSDIPRANARFARQCVERAFQAFFRDGERRFDCGSLDGSFVLPALCDVAPISDEPWARVASEQKLLVAAALIATCHEKGWGSHLVGEQEVVPAPWLVLSLRLIPVTVDYRHYFLPVDGDPIDFGVLVDVDLAIRVA